MKRRHSSSEVDFSPETLALGYGYDPWLSEGAIKPPVFLSSTFQFRSAAAGKHDFELAYGLQPAKEGEETGLIYSRLNNPNLQIFEERLAVWDGTERGAVFASGMAAIATACFALARPGDVILSTEPVYGGTHYLFHHILPQFGIELRFLPAGDDAPARMRAAADELGRARVRMLYLETPANPSLVQTDIAAVAALARELGAESGRPVVSVVDNTFLGPVFQRPAALGADLVLYSATKFIGGHSDLIAGVVTGPAALMRPVLEFRTMLGTMANPFVGWLLLRSLETLAVRMRQQAETALALARLLAEHPRVDRVRYPGLEAPGSNQHAIWARQCSGHGSLISFDVVGGEEAAFRVLDRFEVLRLAVSLGGTESLVEHPVSMTHSDVPRDELARVGVTPGLIRVSVGLEHPDDLKRDLLHALAV
jgi:methionine-gamma-lyase